MRHVELEERGNFDLVDVAAIWPASGPLAEVEAGLEAPVEHGATPAVPDMPPAIGRAIVAVYAALIVLFYLTMARGPEAKFMIAVSAGYLAIFLAVPRIFLRVEGDRSRRPDLGRFLEQGIDTWTGHMKGGSALVQIFVVPVLLTLGMLVIGIAALWILP